MLDKRNVAVQLSPAEKETVTEAVNSPLVEPTPKLFDIIGRLQNGDPVQAREAVKVIDAVARTLSEGDTEAKRDLIRRIEDSMDWRM